MKVYEPHFWECAPRGLRLDATQWTSMLEIQQKTKKKIQGLCLLSLSYYDILFLFA